MVRWRRASAAVLALGGLAVTMPGCMFAVGSTLPGDSDHRVERLEKRMKAAEKRLGLPSPEEGAK